MMCPSSVERRCRIDASPRPAAIFRLPTLEATDPLKIVVRTTFVKVSFGKKRPDRARTASSQPRFSSQFFGRSSRNPLDFINRIQNRIQRTYRRRFPRARKVLTRAPPAPRRPNLSVNSCLPEREDYDEPEWRQQIQRDNRCGRNEHGYTYVNREYRRSAAILPR